MAILGQSSFRIDSKFGFDWIIYNLALADDWIPFRLPFLRGGVDETSKPKTEAEFGIDLAFLSPDRRTFRVFVLKDEPLKNSTWNRHDFDTDLRNASAPPLDDPSLADIDTVEVILSYNKDEDQAGVELYNRRVRSFGSIIGDGVTLKMERWNLTRIVEEVKQSLLTPALLPQKFFSHFSYICAQVGDFVHGSDEWSNQLVPNWRRFLDSVLSENADERSVRLVPVTLMILQRYAEENPSAETAWIDLVEWGMLAVWEVARTTEKESIRDAVWQMWIGLYLLHLEVYYELHGVHLAVEHSLDQPVSGSYVDAAASAVLAHWHLARIGLLGVAFAQLLNDETDEQVQARAAALQKVANWLTSLLNGNPACLRPLLDIHHIELVIASGTLRQAGRHADHATWLLSLVNCLSMRRFGNCQISFLESRNRLDLVFEYLGSGERPTEYCDSSSVYLTCLMEIICCCPPEHRDRLLEMVDCRLVRGLTDDGVASEVREPIDLMLWIPPADWHERILRESLSADGECIMLHLAPMGDEERKSGPEIHAAVKQCVKVTRAEREFTIKQGVPFPVMLLACLKQGSPIPPEFWRSGIFPDLDNVESD